MVKILQIALSLTTLCLLSGRLAQEASAQQLTPSSQISAERCTELLSRGGVFIFFDPSCPICAEYIPTIERLSAKYGSRQPFYLVFKAEDSPAIKGFIADYHPHSLVLCDTNSRLQAALGARVTPEVFLMQSGKVVYSGRIDDRYESIGHRRNVIRSSDLESSLDAIAKGQQPQVRTTAAVGCYIELGKDDQSGGSKHAGK